MAGAIPGRRWGLCHSGITPNTQVSGRHNSHLRIKALARFVCHDGLSRHPDTSCFASSSSLSHLARCGVFAWLAFAQADGPKFEPRTGTVIAASPICACINLGGGLEAPVEGEWGYTIRADDMTRIAQAGFDTVRVPINWAAHTEDAAPYQIDPAFLARIDEVVRQGLAAGLNVIVNVHHYNALNEDPDLHEPRLEAIWQQISRRYADWPEGLIFEPVNEPHSAMTYAHVDALNRRILADIRRTNPTRWVVLGGGHWGHFIGLEKSNPPFDPRVVTTFHFYDPFEFTHQGAHWTSEPMPTGISWGSASDRAAIAKDFARLAGWRDASGMPLFVGEFGAYRRCGHGGPRQLDAVRPQTGGSAGVWLVLLGLGQRVRNIRSRARTLHSSSDHGPCRGLKRVSDARSGSALRSLRCHFASVRRSRSDSHAGYS